MARKKKTENPDDPESTEVTAEQVQDEAQLAAEEQLAATRRAERQERFDSAAATVQDLEQRLDQARREMDLAQEDLGAEVPTAEIATLPKCLPQFDPTIRSARSTRQAQNMTRVVESNDRIVEDLVDENTRRRAAQIPAPATDE